MTDSLSIIAAAISFAPAPRNFDRNVQIQAPAPRRIEVAAPADMKPSESLTTCYEGKSGSCWTEG